MPTVIHFIDVGQGNMTLCQLADGTVLLYDCNVTDENEDQVLGYLEATLGRRKRIDIFANSHRDADHMRGVAKIHALHPIAKVWDSGVTGTTPASTEYREYMALRRSLPTVELERQKRWTFGRSVVRVMNSKNERLPDDANAQSVVLKVEHRNDQGAAVGSALLAGDTDAQTWRYSILRDYSAADLSSDILLASHHGSLSFFDDPADDRNYFTDHLEAIAPAMTVISVGDNAHGHPDPKALAFYEKYSTGSNKGNKLARTDQSGTKILTLADAGGWTLL